MNPLFEDYQDSGLKLSAHLRVYEIKSRVQVMALPRSGIAVGSSLAKALRLPLDVLLVHPILNKEQASDLILGALSVAQTYILKRTSFKHTYLNSLELESLVLSAEKDLEAHNDRYRASKALPLITGHTIILVAGILDTTITLYSALLALKKLNAARVILASPLALASVLPEIEPLVDQCLYLHRIPDQENQDWRTESSFYRNLDDLDDQKIIALLQGNGVV